MKRLRLLLLDANVVFRLFELGLWDAVVEHCEVILTRTVADVEVRYYHGKDADHLIDLSGYENDGRIAVVDLDASELKEFRDLFDPLYLARLDDGEAESLAYLASSEDEHLVSSSDSIVSKVLGRLRRSEQGISLEEILQRIGRTVKGLERQFTQEFREHWTREGGRDMIQGTGLRSDH